MDATLARAPGGYLAFSDDRVILEVNDAAARWLGYEPPALLGRAVSQIVAVTARVALETTLFPLLAVQGRAEELYVSLRTATGEELPVVLNARREEDGGRWVNRWMFLPTRKRHLFEQQLEELGRVAPAEAVEAQLVLRERLASLGTLAAGIGHEINNPLAYVTSNLQLLEEQLRDGAALAAERVAELRALVSEARGGCERIGAIVATLRTMSRLDSDRRDPIELATVVDLALRMTRGDLGHRARVIIELGPAPPVDADEGRLAQVLVDLLVNAGQAFPPGPPEHNVIRVVTRADERGNAVVEVIDNGPGIPGELRGRIFEPFFTTRAVGGGAGLGLSVCHATVTALGGTLGVDSPPGAGACFRIVLPPSRGAARAPQAAPPAPAKVAPHRARVLVVDDEPMVGRTLSRVLRPHEVCSVTRAADALARITAGEPFDLVLCDLMMPEMNGAELHAAVATIAPPLTARMVFMTGGVFSEEMDAFMRSVPNRRFNKPFKVDEVRAICDALLAPGHSAK